MNSLLQNFGITPRDDLLTETQRFTYVNEALNSSSCIDHCFLSGGLHALVNKVSIIEFAINCSDHRPVVVVLDYNWSQVNVATGGSNRPKPVTYKVRWDKGSVYEYYRVTGEALSSLRLDSLCLCCSPGCHSLQHQQAINSYYDSIVTGLNRAERATIPRIPHSALRSIWDDELDAQKDKSIFWHN